MASIDVRERANRTVYAVLFRIDGHRGSKQTSVTWPTMAEAQKFKKLVDAVGGRRAMEIHGIHDTTPSANGLTVGEWLDYHIAHLTGVEKKTISDYERYARDMAQLHDIPLAALKRDDVILWVKSLEDRNAGKTIQNKHGFLSSALKRAVKDGKLPANPCEDIRIKRTEKVNPVFLSRDEYQLLYSCFTEFYRPMVDFLVGSGARFSEMAALKPTDINWTDGEVRIVRAWKRIPGVGWEMGAPKSLKGVRDIHVPLSVLAPLDRSGAWVFVNKAGNPVRVYGWRENVWYPTVKKAQEKGLQKKPRIHDLRHTCASWMIAASVPMKAIQEHLGHESIKTTIDLYGHLDPATKKLGSAAIAAALARQT